MSTIRGSRGVAILFFTMVIALFGYFIYFLVTGNTDPAYYWQQPANREPVPLRTSDPTSKSVAAALNNRLILLRNEAQTIGKLRITYLGIADKRLLFDVNLLDLDPNFAYRYAIPLAQSKKRFRIAENYFQAKATSNSKVRLVQVSLK
jgi:hypothetical protein